jgi:hypothetical protein
MKVPELPLRSVVVAPSGGGKRTFMVSLILDTCRGCFKRICVFSPTALLDDVWKPVGKYAETLLRQQDTCLYDELDEEEVQKIIRRHHRITKLCKENERSRLLGALIIVEDFADNRWPGLHPVARLIGRPEELLQLGVEGNPAKMTGHEVDG